MIEPGQETARILVLGVSGSGKSHLLRQTVIPMLESKSRYMVYLNNSDEFSQLAAAHYVIGDERVDLDIDLKALIKSKGSVSFEVLAVDPTGFLDRLAVAMYELGEVGFICDESDDFIADSVVPASMLRIPKGGRKRGIHYAIVSQSFKRSPTSGLSIVFRKQSNMLVVFRVVDTDADTVAAMLGGFDPSTLRPYEAHTGAAPEYVVSDTKTGRIVASLRSGPEVIRE